jgi:hypothetical protein
VTLAEFVLNEWNNEESGTFSIHNCTFTWEDRGNNLVGEEAEISGLSGGDYTVTLNHSNGCNISETVTVISPYFDECGLCFEDDNNSQWNLSCLGCTDSAAGNYDADAIVDNGTCEYGYQFTHNLSIGNNLISLPGYLDNTNSQNLMNEIIDDGNGVNFLLGQGLGLFNTADGWAGNLTNISPHSGYWINTSDTYIWNILFEEGGLGNCESYQTASGNNFLSYKWGNGAAPTLDALGGEAFAAENFNFILGQGLGIFNTSNGWVGNLTNLEEGKGYWVNISNSSLDFKWGFDNCTNSTENLSLTNEDSTIPQEYQFIQSTEQAFYLIKEITIDGEIPKSDDIVLAFNNNVLVGSAYFNESVTILPVMGKDISEQTIGFLNNGEIPQLKLYQSSTDKMINLETELEGFSNLLVSEVGLIKGNTIIIPTEFILHPAYPNPFNPTTNISYGLPSETHISLNVFSVEGRKITTLTEGIKTAGNHYIEWNADGFPSGVYFLKLEANEFTQTQKLMLVK